MPEPLSSEELEAITRMAAKVVEVFDDDWDLHYSADGDEVSCRTDYDNPFEGSYVEIFNTSQWPSSSEDSPVAEFLGASIVVIPRLIAEVERRLNLEDVERFLKRERDEYEPRGECWNTVDDVLDCFRLHMVTGTPLTDPRPEEGPGDPSVGSPPLTEAEELRAENERLAARVAEQEPTRIAPTVFMVETEENVGATLLQMIDQDGREVYVGLDDHMRDLLVSMLVRNGGAADA